MTLPAAPLAYDPHLERIEIELLLEGVFRHYGFDFRSYAYASLRRRIWKRVEQERLETVTALTERVLHEPAMMERLLLDLSINVTAMFRDPGFHAAFRRDVVVVWPVTTTCSSCRMSRSSCAFTSAWPGVSVTWRCW